MNHGDTHPPTHLYWLSEKVVSHILISKRANFILLTRPYHNHRLHNFFVERTLAFAKFAFNLNVNLSAVFEIVTPFPYKIALS